MEANRESSFGHTYFGVSLEADGYIVERFSSNFPFSGLGDLMQKVARSVLMRK